MSRQSVRRISFQSIKGLFGGNSRNISKPVTSLPKVTGQGPFSEKPQFEPIGTPANLLNVKLPASSILNLRLDAKQHKTLAINGDSSSLVVELGKLSSGLIYQRCFNQANALSILLSSKATNGSFMVLETSEKSGWAVPDSASLVGWTGNHVDITGTTDIRISGQDGVVALSAAGQVLQLKLEQGEAIQVAPQSIVAYSVSSEESDVLVPASLSTTLGIGSVSLWTKIRALSGQLSSLLSQYVTGPLRAKLELSDKPVLPESVRRLWGSIKGAASRAVTNQVKLVQVTGPRTLFLTNYMVGRPANLSTKQVQSLV